MSQFIKHIVWSLAGRLTKAMILITTNRIKFTIDKKSLFSLILSRFTVSYQRLPPFFRRSQSAYKVICFEP